MANMTAQDNGNRQDGENEEDKDKVSEKERSLEKEEIPVINLSQFFDIIGQINIILKSESSVSFTNTSYPFESVGSGEIMII